MLVSIFMFGKSSPQLCLGIVFAFIDLEINGASFSVLDLEQFSLVSISLATVIAFELLCY